MKMKKRNKKILFEPWRCARLWGTSIGDVVDTHELWIEIFALFNATNTCRQKHSNIKINQN